MKRWEIKNELRNENGELKIDEILTILLENRGITSEKEIENFLHPKLEDVTVDRVGIDKKQLQKTLKRLKKAIDQREEIIVFGDYDVDGITGSAIMWEALSLCGAKAMPYIPDRIEEGYGLSIKGIAKIQELYPTAKLIITVDNGIVANEAVAVANEKGFEVIITDHHVSHGAEGTLPPAYAIVHTTQLCGAGVAYVLSKELYSFIGLQDVEDIHLELATLGTVADLVPLTGANRTIVKYGLKALSLTRRPGLIELFTLIGCTPGSIGVYEIGYMIAPRLNAAGRMESAMESLRLICTRDRMRARELADKLNLVNKERQVVMQESTQHASLTVRSLPGELKHILVVTHDSYQEGVIGLIAGKLVEEFYRPAIVIAKRDGQSKASVRSITGFNIIEFLRSHSEYFVNVGGHPMAAGFTVETEKITALQAALETSAADLLTDELLTRTLKIDCALQLSQITFSLFHAVETLAPFGMSNPQPVFMSTDVEVADIRTMGKDGRHVKIKVRQDGIATFDAVGFGMADELASLRPGDRIAIAYTIDQNTWNNDTKLQLKLKDVKMKE